MGCVGFELREIQSFLNSEFYSKGEASLGLAGFLLAFMDWSLWLQKCGVFDSYKGITLGRPPLEARVYHLV